MKRRTVEMPSLSATSQRIEKPVSVEGFHHLVIRQHTPIMVQWLWCLSVWFVPVQSLSPATKKQSTDQEDVFNSQLHSPNDVWKTRQSLKSISMLSQPLTFSSTQPSNFDAVCMTVTPGHVTTARKNTWLKPPHCVFDCVSTTCHRIQTPKLGYNIENMPRGVELGAL